MKKLYSINPYRFTKVYLDYISKHSIKFKESEYNLNHIILMDYIEGVTLNDIID
jgi:hypothetical protein